MTINDAGATLLIGVGATAMTDLWCLMRKRLFGVPLPNYAFVGRWIAHMTRGRLRHNAIAAAAPIRTERAIGWSTHYLIGVAFASLLPAIWGLGWLRQPTLGPALLIGIATVIAPFLVMQPAMGAGFAASRTPKPRIARFHSLVMHGVFAIGLYLAARFVSYLSIGG